MTTEHHLPLMTAAALSRVRRALAGLLALAAVAAAAPALARTIIVEPPPPPPLPAHSWHAVLMAGDGSLEVWDHAVEAVANGLASGGNTSTLNLFSGREDRIAKGASRASVRDVLQTISNLQARPGEGCMVFLTSHGARDSGLVLGGGEGVITPTALDRALTSGCGNVPTVVIASGCYSGNFAEGPMTRANRVILTAARSDRSSFGCGSTYHMTVYDECLVSSLQSARTASMLASQVASCVRQTEQRGGYGPASEPQAWLGSQAFDQLPAFGSKGHGVSTGVAGAVNAPAGTPPKEAVTRPQKPGTWLRIVKEVVDRLAAEEGR